MRKENNAPGKDFKEKEFYSSSYESWLDQLHSLTISTQLTDKIL